MKTMRGISLVTLSILLFLAGYLATRQARIYGQATSRTPFSLVTVQYQVVGNTTKDLEHDYRYLRSDGATSFNRILMPNGSFGKNTRRLTFPNGLQVQVSEDAHAKSTTLKSPTSASSNNPNLKQDPTTCAWPMETVGEPTKVIGLPAYTLVYIHSNNPLARDVDTRVPQFDCVAVAHLEQYRTDTSSEWFTKVGTRLQSLTPGEPPAAVFTDFTDYTEMTPSDLRRATFIAHGLTKAVCAECFDDNVKADNYYGSHRP